MVLAWRAGELIFIWDKYRNQRHCESLNDEVDVSRWAVIVTADRTELSVTWASFFIPTALTSDISLVS